MQVWAPGIKVVRHENERDWAWVQASIPVDLTKINERKKSKKKKET